MEEEPCLHGCPGKKAEISGVRLEHLRLEDAHFARHAPYLILIPCRGVQCLVEKEQVAQRALFHCGVADVAEVSRAYRGGEHRLPVGRVECAVEGRVDPGGFPFRHVPPRLVPDDGCAIAPGPAGRNDFNVTRRKACLAGARVVHEAPGDVGAQVALREHRQSGKPFRDRHGWTRIGRLPRAVEGDARQRAFKCRLASRHVVGLGNGSPPPGGR